MRNVTILLDLLSLIVISSCKTKNKLVSATDISEAEKVAFSQIAGDTIQIKNAEISYEIIIIEPGFTTWLQSVAKSEGYYSQSFLENRNQIMVVSWNQRVLQPTLFNSNIYEMQIDYQNNINYGYNVNYKLYNYFIYFQRKYRQQLGPFIPRI